ncbi:MAG: septal ring lytic transglycosylase RlpA family protein, partial [Terriglobales bacterium]
MLPPAPPMPAGVSWGAPLPPNRAATTEAAPAATVPPAAARTPAFATVHYPAPPSAGLPVDNYSADPRAGEIWETGIASFYGPREQGKDTASGQPFDYHKMTAAHRLLPLGTKIKVTDLKTNKSVVVTINDRGPFWPNRLLDLSWGAAKKIGDVGLDPVRIRIVSVPDPVPPGVYTVMVGWFTDNSQLERCQKLMQQQLHQPVITRRSDEGRWLRYAKTTHLDMATALDEVRSLRAAHYPAYLV